MSAQALEAARRLVQRWRTNPLPPEAARLETEPLGHPITPPSNARDLLVLDSSFNPPTIAHESMLVKALTLPIRPVDERAPPRDPLRFASALCLFCTRNVDKAALDGAPRSELDDRVAMAALLFDRISVANCQRLVGLTSMGRFAEKAQLLAGHVAPGGRIAFLVGHDTLVRLFDRKYYGGTDEDTERALVPFFRSAVLICEERLGSDTCRFLSSELVVTPALRLAMQDRVFLVGTTSEDLGHVSSTNVRSSLKSVTDSAAHAHLPPAIERYVSSRGLYM